MCPICHKETCTCTPKIPGVPFALRIPTGNWLDWLLRIGGKKADQTSTIKVPLTIRVKTAGLSGGQLNLTMEATSTTEPVEWSSDRRNWSTNPQLSLTNTPLALFVFARLVSDRTNEAGIRVNGLVNCPVTVSARRGTAIKTSSGKCYTIAAESGLAVGDCFDETASGLVADTNCVLFDAAAPQPALGISAVSLSASSIGLTFSGIGNATKLLVERSRNGTSGWSTVSDDADASGVADNNLSGDTLYYYRVTATLPLPLRMSAIASARTSVTTQPTLTLGATATGTTTIELAFGGVGNATSLQLERSPDGTTGWVVIKNNALATGYTDTGLSDNTNYYYRLNALLPTPVRTSAVAQAKTVAATATALPAISSFNVTAPTATTTHLVIANVAGAEDFEVDRSPNGVDSWDSRNANLDAGTAATVVLDEMGLTPATQYFYRTRAKAVVGGVTIYSPYILNNITTPALAALQPPSDLVATANSPTSTHLSFTAVPTATGYDIDRSLNGVDNWVGVASNVNSTSFDDPLVTQGATQYAYRIRSRRGLVQSAYSPNLLYTTPEPVILDAVAGTTTPYAIPALTAMGYNGTTDYNALNFLLSSSEAVVVQFSQNGAVVTGTVLAGDAGRFVAPGGPWAGYGSRVRLDRRVANTGGFQPNTAYTVKIHTVANPMVTFVFTWTPQPLTNTQPVVIPLPTNGSSLGTLANYLPVVQSTTAITVGWSAYAGATSYQTQRSLDGVGGWTNLPDTNTTSLADTGLTPGTMYYYQTRAKNGSTVLTEWAQGHTATLSNNTGPGGPSSMSLNDYVGDAVTYGPPTLERITDKAYMDITLGPVVDGFYTITGDNAALPDQYYQLDYHKDNNLSSLTGLSFPEGRPLLIQKFTGTNGPGDAPYWTTNNNRVEIQRITFPLSN